MKNFKDFVYKKLQYENDAGVTYYWYLIHKKQRNGIHFHGCKTKFENSLKYIDNQFGFMTYGIEKHSKTPLYEGQTALPDCDVTGGDCYCDGTSLYARERLGHINPDDLRYDNEIWFVLHDFYDSHFKGQD